MYLYRHIYLHTPQFELLGFALCAYELIASHVTHTHIYVYIKCIFMDTCISTHLSLSCSALRCVRVSSLPASSSASILAASLTLSRVPSDRLFAGLLVCGNFKALQMPLHLHREYVFVWIYIICIHIKNIHMCLYVCIYTYIYTSIYIYVYI